MLDYLLPTLLTSVHCLAGEILPNLMRLNQTVLFDIILVGWFTTFFKDSVDPDDNFDSRPGANLFIKHIRYESEATEPPSVATEQKATNGDKPTTESIPFNNIFTRKDSDNEFADRKQVDAEEEALKQLYERGDGGAADGEITTTGKESTEIPSNKHDCISKINSI